MTVGWWRRIDEHVIHARTGRPAPDGPLEADERIVVAVRFDFDGPVGQIADEPVYAFASGGITREEPEADALHTA
jgi:hypothetical protein